MTHEARARALPVYTEAQGVAYLAAAFAEVEAAEKARLIAMADAEKDCAHAVPPGCWEESVEGSIYCAAHQGDDSIPGASGLPVPKHCQECGKNPCETFIVCASKELERSAYARMAAGPVVCAELTKGDGKIQMPCSRERDHRGPHALRASMRFESEAQYRAYYGLEWPTTASKACTCGAASCGSRIHSSWCDLA